MKRVGLLAIMLIVALVLSSPNANAAVTTIDLTTAGANNGAGTAAAVGGTFLVQQISPQSTGTGVIDSFLRVQANGSEQGYNTSTGTPYDDKAGNFTRALSLSEVPTVTINGVVYRQFLLDINQTTPGTLLNLNQIEIFANNGDPACPAPASTCGTTVTGGGAMNNFPTLAFPGSPSSPIFEMSAGGIGGTQSTILMNFTLNPGSGAGDMFLYVPNVDFTGLTNVILYSQFGNPPGANPSDDGFEEWAVLKPSGSPCVGACEVNVPEPGSLILLGTGMAVLGLLKRKRVQN